MPVSNSFRKEKTNKESNTINTPSTTKKEYNIQGYPHKLNRYYSYGVSITTPTKDHFHLNLLLSYHLLV